MRREGERAARRAKKGDGGTFWTWHAEFVRQSAIIATMAQVGPIAGEILDWDERGKRAKTIKAELELGVFQRDLLFAEDVARQVDREIATDAARQAALAADQPAGAIIVEEVAKDELEVAEAFALSDDDAVGLRKPVKSLSRSERRATRKRA